MDCRKSENEKSSNNLYDTKVGKTVRITNIDGDPSACQRLREIGFCEMAEVCKIAHGGALICHVLNGKVALSQKLAKQIYVEEISDSSPKIP